MVLVGRAPIAFNETFITCYEDARISSLGSCARVTRLRNVPTHRNVPKGTPFYLYLSRLSLCLTAQCRSYRCPSSMDIETKHARFYWPRRMINVDHSSPPSSLFFSPRSKKIRKIQLRMIQNEIERIGERSLLGKGTIVKTR